MSDFLSKAGLELLLKHEVGGGEAYYNAKLKHPTWPGGESGPTIGIGYDLGYTPRERFLANWAAMDDDDRARLAMVVGVKGLKARERVKAVADVLIPWELAYRVFCFSTLPYWVEQTRRAYPGVDALPGDARSALVSIVFNRGAAMDGDRRREMRVIRDLVAEYAKAGVSEIDRRGLLRRMGMQVLGMRRLWYGKGLEGLVRRREDEAVLMRTC
jgi:hypothetical protein